MMALVDYDVVLMVYVEYLVELIVDVWNINKEI
jgi:hypothetical protein